MFNFLIKKAASNISTEVFQFFTQILASLAPAPPVLTITPRICSFSFTNSLGMSSSLNMSNKAKGPEQRVRRLNDG
jgi:hypothetical protein